MRLTSQIIRLMSSGFVFQPCLNQLQSFARTGGQQKPGRIGRTRFTNRNVLGDQKIGQVRFGNFHLPGLCKRQPLLALNALSGDPQFVRQQQLFTHLFKLPELKERTIPCDRDGSFVCSAAFGPIQPAKRSIRISLLERLIGEPPRPLRSDRPDRES